MRTNRLSGANGLIKKDVLLVFLGFFIAFNRYTHFLIAELVRRISGGNLTWFVERWQLDSDMLVRNRLQSNLDHGLFSYLFSLGHNGEYLSQVGLGGWVLTLPVFLLHRIRVLSDTNYSLPAPEMGMSGFIGLGILYSLVALLNSAIALWCYLKIKEKTTFIRALIFSAFLLQPWSLAINSSLYWMIGLKVLPGIYVTSLILKDKKMQKKEIFILFFLSVLSFLSGYEFSTVVIMLVVSPMIFVLIMSLKSKQEKFLVFIKPIATVFFAFFFSLGVQIFILLAKLHTINNAIVQMKTIVYKRTGIASVNVDAIYNDSLRSSPIGVLSKYLNMPLLADPVTPSFLSGIHLWHFVILITMMWLWRSLYNKDQEISQTYFALGTSWLFSLLGPLGWYLLARPHSAGHTHIDFALWSFYTIPFGVLLCFGKFPKLDKNFRNLRKSIGVVLMVIALILIMLIISQFLSQ